MYVTPETFFEVIVRDKYKCVFCGTTENSVAVRPNPDTPRSTDNRPFRADEVSTQCIFCFFKK